MATNFFHDNEDLRFYFDKGLDWDPVVRLTERDFRAGDGHASTADALKFYRDIVDLVGGFVAEEIALGRRVVVKVLEPELAQGLSADRFAREAKLAARLQDPRIVPVLSAGSAGDLPYYSMPFVEGETLRARMARATASGELVTLGECASILRDVALALEYAHAPDVVHRDIKPENILLSGRTAMVADFGIAKALVAASTAGAGQRPDRGSAPHSQSSQRIGCSPHAGLGQTSRFQQPGCAHFRSTGPRAFCGHRRS